MDDSERIERLREELATCRAALEQIDRVPVQAAVGLLRVWLGWYQLGEKRSRIPAPVEVTYLLLGETPPAPRVLARDGGSVH